MSEYHLGQINVAHLHHPLDHDETAEFVAALDPVNEVAESCDGFIWRLRDEDGQSSSYVPVDGIDDPLLIVNYSIWEDLESLRHFMYKSGHASYLRRRREWFEPPAEESTVLWWVPAGTVPTLDEASERLRHLRAHGSTADAWSLRRPFPPPDSG